MFKVGDKVVYPMHGAGVIEAIEFKEIGGKTVEYFRVRIYSGNIKLMIPVSNPSGVQLRPVVSKEEAARIIDSFDSDRTSSNIPWNKRYKENIDKLKSGTADNVAGVLNDLILREKKHGLSTSDRKMFILTKSILCSELNTALETDNNSEVLERILSKF